MTNLIYQDEWKHIVEKHSKVKGDFCMQNILSPNKDCYIWKIGSDDDPEFIDISNWVFTYQEKGERNNYTFPQLITKLKFGYDVKNSNISQYKNEQGRDRDTEQKINDTKQDDQKS